MHSSRNAEHFGNNRQTVQPNSNSNSVHSSYNLNAKVFSDDNLTAHTSTDRYATEHNVQNITESGVDHTIPVVENSKTQISDRNEVCYYFYLFIQD